MTFIKKSRIKLNLSINPPKLPIGNLDESLNLVTSPSRTTSQDATITPHATQCQRPLQGRSYQPPLDVTGTTDTKLVAIPKKSTIINISESSEIYKKDPNAKTSEDFKIEIKKAVQRYSSKSQ